MVLQWNLQWITIALQCYLWKSASLAVSAGAAVRRICAIKELEKEFIEMLEFFDGFAPSKN